MATKWVNIAPFETSLVPLKSCESQLLNDANFITKAAVLSHLVSMF